MGVDGLVHGLSFNSIFISKYINGDQTNLQQRTYEVPAVYTLYYQVWTVSIHPVPIVISRLFVPQHSWANFQCHPVCHVNIYP